MKILKTIWVLIVSISLHIILSPFGAIVLVASILMSMLKILKETITFLMEQIKYEVLKPLRDEQKNEKHKEG